MSYKCPNEAQHREDDPEYSPAFTVSATYSVVVDAGGSQVSGDKSFIEYGDVGLCTECYEETGWDSEGDAD